jgi:hypothetical protein
MINGTTAPHHSRSQSRRWAGYRRELPSLRHSRTVLGAVMIAVAVSASALSGGVVGVARAVSDPRDVTNVPFYVYQQGSAAVQAWQERCRRTEPTPPQALVVVPSPMGATTCSTTYSLRSYGVPNIGFLHNGVAQ